MRLGIVWLHSVCLMIEWGKRKFGSGVLASDCRKTSMATFGTDPKPKLTTTDSKTLGWYRTLISRHCFQPDF